MECAACETPREAKTANSASLSNPGVIVIDDDDDSGFSDTLKGSTVQCDICGCEFPSRNEDALNEHTALHLAEQTDLIAIDTNTNSSSATKNATYGTLKTAYEQQYARSFEKAMKSSLSPAQIAEHLKSMSKNLMTMPDIESSVNGLMEALAEHYRRHPNFKRDVILATSVTHYASGFGDLGWGCGYRNIQMMSSVLAEYPHYKKNLFGPHIPSVPVLQQCLDAAWAAGFDPGSKDKRFGVFGGNKWIGTYDAVSLLRSFRVPLELVSFGADLRAKYSGNNASTSKGDPENDEEEASDNRRNTNGSNIVSISSIITRPAVTFRRFQPSLYVPHVKMFEWVWKYFETCRRRKDKIILPLYLQHDGHSRTIVGAENMNGKIALLTFDPSFDQGDHIHALKTTSSKIPEDLRKTLSEFRHRNYQIAYVADPTFVIPLDLMNEYKKIRQPPMIISKAQ